MGSGWRGMGGSIMPDTTPTVEQIAAILAKHGLYISSHVCRGRECAARAIFEQIVAPLLAEQELLVTANQHWRVVAALRATGEEEKG